MQRIYIWIIYDIVSLTLLHTFCDIHFTSAVWIVLLTWQYIYIFDISSKKVVD